MDNKIIIVKADENKILEIRDIASKIWPVAYRDIITEDQINYMLEKMYDPKILKEQITTQNHQFYILYNGDLPIGFVGFELNYDKKNTTKIHKLYLLPETKGLGFGRMLLNIVVNAVQQQQFRTIVLNVNKKNPAVHFYLKNGFKIKEEVVLDIGNNFVMDDYIMELEILH